MSGRKPLLENDEPLVIAALKEFSLRDQALIILGLNTGFRITEILSLTVGQVWDAGRVKAQVKVSRAQLKGGRGRHRKTVVSRSVPLNAAVTAVLEQYLFARFGSGAADPLAPLFPSRKHGASITRWQANRFNIRCLEDHPEILAEQADGIMDGKRLLLGPERISW